MKAISRVALVVTALLLPLTVAGCASASREEQAQELAQQFVTWMIDDVTSENGQKGIDEDVAAKPFDQLCEGAESRAYGQIAWMQTADEIDQVDLVKSEDDETFYFVVKTIRDGKYPDQDMPVRVKVVGGGVCIDGAGEAAKS